MTTALVLGATGFLGGHIALEALARGWRVRGLRRRPGAEGILGSREVEWFGGDLDRVEGLHEAFHGVDVVFHAAAYYPSRSGRVAKQVTAAVKQMRNVLLTTRSQKAGLLVYTSSLTTLGMGEGRVDESHFYLPGSIPQSAYYECKFAMESEVFREAAFGLPVVVLNPTLVLGPGDVHAVFADIFRLAGHGLASFWVPARFNVIDVRDVARAHVNAVERGHAGERYLLGGHNLSVRELIDAVNAVVGRPPAKLRLPNAIVDLAVALSGLTPALAFAGNHLRAIRQMPVYDSSKAQRELGLVPRPLAETLGDAWSWYQRVDERRPPRDMV